MKTLLLFILSFVTLSYSFARGGTPDTEADYIVPTPPEYVAFSRFKVDIVERFKGPETQEISYVFPEFLIGETGKVLSMKRVIGTENSWQGDDLNAHCTVIGEDFSCNIYVDKNRASILRSKAIKNLNNLNLSQEKLRGFAGVINSFYSHEPAGFLSYDID